MKYISLLLLSIAAGCASLGLPTPTTYNERLAAAYVTVTTVRQETVGLLRAKKITPDDAQNIQGQADNIRAGLDISSQIFKTDPAGANAKLSATLTALTALQTYLAARKGAK